MADDGCATRNPLIRAGLTQSGRALKELGRGYFLPDERDLADLVLFGQKFAAQVAFYGPLNGRDGDWQAFFESDITAALAALAKLPVEAFRQFQSDLERWLRAEPGRDAGQLGAHFRLWFHLAPTLLATVGRHHARLPNDHPLTASLPRLVARDLAQPLTGLAGWYKGAAADGAGPAADLFADTALLPADYNLAGGADDRVRLSSTVAAAVFGGQPYAGIAVPPALMALVPPGTWAGLVGAAPADAAPYADAGAAYGQIYDALTYNILTRSAERVMQGFLRLRQDAEASLAASLTDFASHPAHYGLWLAFLKVFRHAQGRMNAFTGRHLDYYFREVLRLKPRAAMPDRAHLTFGLAKGVDRHLLARGTGFRAGKDGLGRPVTFTLDDDLVVNRGAVAALKGVRLETGTASGLPTLLPRAATVVNSADGLGEIDLPEDAPAFPPFGPTLAPAARIGFAVADRRLFLREGNRSFVLRAELPAALPAGLAPTFRVWLSGAEGWFEAPTVSVEIRADFEEEVAGNREKDSPGKTFEDAKGTAKEKDREATRGGKRAALRSGKEEDSAAEKREARRRRGKPGKETPVMRRFAAVQITVTLGPEDPAVIPVEAKLHGTEHRPGVPVAEVLFDFAPAASRRAYAAMRDLHFQRLTLRAEASGLKMLTVIADGAEADPAKPFAPFGPRPVTGNTLILGSSEIFSKRIESWSLSLDWKTPYSTSSFYRARSAGNYQPVEHILRDGAWVLAGGTYSTSGRVLGTEIGLGESGATVSLQSGDLIDGKAAQVLDNPPLDAASVNGFLKLVLDEDFGHRDYPVEQARAMVDLARGVAHSRVTGVNYDPNPKSDNIGILPRLPYDPEITRIEAAYATLRSPVAGLSLLAPFGIEPAGGNRLFPTLPFTGALYIGVEAFEAPARLTLLIQVEDGSGDPLLPVPELSFAWLDGEAWVPFADQDVDDKTLNLTTSGILGLALPAGADTAHRAMPDGLTWVRITAPSYPEALNRLRSVTAQAGRVSFADAGNDPARLAGPLPPGTIAKTVEPVPQVKTVVQPYASFGGRPVETPPAMDIRVAERLRHKDRAITMWDVEALVLDAFPGLWRVKCLGLTELRRNAQGVVVADNEQMPGAVSVVAVPVIGAGSARDPLRPYADQATLTAVDRFLRPRFSPFVRLEVTNPKVEEVQLDFKVRFRPEIKDIAFYVDELNKALIGYLTPWAGPGGGEITFGGKLWRSSVIDFLDERPEVDFVTEVKLYHKPDIAAPPGGWTPIPVEVVETTSARSILVSAVQHVITEVPANG